MDKNICVENNSKIRKNIHPCHVPDVLHQRAGDLLQVGEVSGHHDPDDKLKWWDKCLQAVQEASTEVNDTC